MEILQPLPIPIHGFRGEILHLAVEIETLSIFKESGEIEPILNNPFQKIS
jgi:hypothetical protein